MPSTFKFPYEVSLQDKPIISLVDLQAALGNPSRQLLHLWRKNRGFPTSHKNGVRSFYATREIIHWLTSQSIKTKQNS